MTDSEFPYQTEEAIADAKASGHLPADHGDAPEGDGDDTGKDGDDAQGMKPAEPFPPAE